MRGTGTRLVEYVQRMPKSYVGTFILGRESTTEDIEGEIVELADPPVPTLKEIQEAAKKLEGHIQQRPPAYSAIKINGRRAYKMARKGEAVQLQARPVSIYRIAVRSYEYPQMVLEVECGSGTYIRSLGRDLAESLQTAAVMSALVRTAIGKFDVKESLDPGKLTKENIGSHILPMIHALDYLPLVELSAEEIGRVHRGQEIRKRVNDADAAELAAVDEQGNLAAILSSSDGELLHPVRNFLI